MLHLIKALLIIGSLMMLTGGANAALLHKYTFDSGPVAVDSTGGVNGTLFGGAAIVNGSLSLNGSDAYVETTGNHIVPTSGDFTVVLFAKQTTFSAGVTELISQGASGSGFYIGYAPSHNFRITDANLVTSIPFPTDGQYHCYALTNSGGTGTFYIDGVFQGTFPTLSVGAGGTDTRFGRQFDPAGEFFDGDIDNVQIYDTALSASEIARIADDGPNPFASVPTMTEWGMIIFIALAGLIATLYLTRQRGRKVNRVS